MITLDGGQRTIAQRSMLLRVRAQVCWSPAMIATALFASLTGPAVSGVVVGVSPTLEVYQALYALLMHEGKP